MESKSIFISKTFWTNVVGLVAMAAQGFSGKELIPLELQGGILSLVNIILRSVTKKPVNWS